MGKKKRPVKKLQRVGKKKPPPRSQLCTTWDDGTTVSTVGQLMRQLEKLPPRLSLVNRVGNLPRIFVRGEGKRQAVEIRY